MKMELIETGVNKSAGVRLRELSKTCCACPAQWEGKTESGVDIYIRFRGGAFYARLFPWTDMQTCIFSAAFNGPWGTMTTRQMLEMTGLIYEARTPEEVDADKPCADDWEEQG